MEVDNIPEEWVKVCVEDLGMIKTERIDPTDYPETEFELWSVPSYETGSPKYVKGEEVGSRKQIVEENDVLLSRINPRLNRVWVVTEQKSQPQIASTEWVVFRCQEVNSRFLRYALLQPHFKRLMCDHVSGVGGSLSRTRKRDLRQFKIGIPPLPEQRRIADRLDAIQSRTQATGETLDQVPDRIEEYRQSVLNAAFTGHLTADWREDHPDVESAEEFLERILDERHEQWKKDYRAKYEAKDRDPPSGWKSRYSIPEGPDRDDVFELPETWTWVRIQQLSNVYSGVTKNSSKSGDIIEMPYLRVANVYADELRLDEIKQIKLKRTKRWKYLLEEGDLLVVEGNGSKKHIGRVAEWDGSIEPCVHQNHLIKVRPARRSTGRYVLNWMLSARGRRFIANEAKTTSGLYSLSLTKVRNTPVPLPPEKEQEEIVRRINQRLDKIDEMALHVEQAGERLDHLDRSVLAKAFRGELVETEDERARREDRDYETAEELLDRVQGESPSEDQATSSEEQSSTTSTQVGENGQFEMKVVEDDPNL